MNKYDIPQLVEDLYVLGILPKQVIPPPTPPEFPSGTRMLFQQTAAPVGWTKITTFGNHALRVVGGSITSGGTVDFSSVFSSSRAVAGSISNTVATGSVAGHVLSVNELPSHNHQVASRYMDAGTNADGSSYAKIASTGELLAVKYTGAEGGDQAHAHGFSGVPHGHTFTGTAMNFDVKFVDVIIAQKD